MGEAQGVMAGLLDTLAGMLGYVRGEPNPETGAMPATPTTEEPLTTTTVASIRAMLDEHDRGSFLRSALLADLLRRDADLFAALQQRILSLQACPHEIRPADDSDAALAAALEVFAHWPLVVSQAVWCDVLCDMILLGFSVGQLVWTTRDDGTLWPHLEHVPASSVEYNRTERQWYVHTLTAGRLAITPGDAQWVLFAPRSATAPWLWGAIRCTAEWYLRSSDAASDASRRAEVTGGTIWKAFLPSGARKTPEGKAFAGSFRTMGRNPVIPCPRGATDAESYDAELVEAQVDAHAIFDFLLRTSGGRIRLAVLGQDLTSQNNKVGTNASSETGLTVTDRIVQADARGWSECATTQIVTPIARYRGTPVSRVVVDAEPDEDWSKRADAMTKAAGAVKAWRDQGVNVDVDKLAREAGVPTLPGTYTPTAPTPPNKATSNA